MCNFLDSVSSQQKFEVTDQLLDGPVLQLRVTAQFYLENKGKYILKACGCANPKDPKRRGMGRERELERGRSGERESVGGVERERPSTL